MPTKSSTPITFVVPGQSPRGDGAGTRGATADTAPSRLPGGLHGGRLKHSVQLRATRSGGTNVPVEAVPGSDVVVIEITGGPALVLHPETARELLLTQGDVAVARSRTDDGADTVSVPSRLQWGGLDAGFATRGSRGVAGTLVSAFHVVTGLLEGPAADFTAEQIARRFDSQVADRVYALDRRALPKLKEQGTAVTRLPDDAGQGPTLVLIHGTFSSTQGTFQKLWANHPDHVDALFQSYGNRVYALDHSTLGSSPIDNAVTLVRSLGKGARLHLVTHSRGGLVAEVLAKVCGAGVKDSELGDFKGAKYQAQVKALKSLADLVADRKIEVERVVRVACPVRGTLLASKRLDAYLSVFKWSLELAGIPVAPALVDFLAAVAQRRTDPMLMPGLAAQVPDSPLIRWLHGTGTEITGDLRVIAGDLAGDSVGSWLKTLLSDAFYWTDNDLVVQTRGMYGGPPRASGGTFLLDRGGAVSHFNYFANERSAGAVVNALTQASPQGFQPIGQDSWAGKSATGVRGARVAARPPAGDRPAVIIVPDVFASHLRIGKQRIWLSGRSSSQFGRLTYSAKGPKVEPDGLVESAYGDLSNVLAETHDVVPFAYDWRRPIEDGAHDLANAVEAVLDARKARKNSGRAVRVIAHGMGGLLVRAMALASGDTWKRLLEPNDARILLLGVHDPPFGTPMQVLSGDETFGGLLQGLSAPMRDQDTRAIIAGFPGFMQLLAGLDDRAAPLANETTWGELADKDLASVRKRSRWHSADEQIDVYDWGRPKQDVLDKVVELRAKLNKQAASGLGSFAEKILSIVGTAPRTPDGYDADSDPFTYFDVVAAGDGYVTTKSALLPGVRAWTVDSDHGGLTTNPDAFASYAELLEKGDTKTLKPVTSAETRGMPSSETRERRRPAREPVVQSTAPTGDLLSVDVRHSASGSTTTVPSLAVTVVNGNLKFIHQPLMLGHYRSLKLTGTEYVMDGLVGGTMTELVRLRQYPDLPGSNKVFVNRRVARENPWQVPRPAAVIVVGLGEEGKLTTTDLTSSVTQGVIAWAQRLVESAGSAPAEFELAATLIGSGGAGVSPGQSALAIAQGVREANEKLIDLGWPIVSHLGLVELYLDRASEAWRALQLMAMASPSEYRVAPTVKAAPGSLRRPIDTSYRGTDYDFVTATTQRDLHGSSTIAYRLDTRRARTEVHAHALQAPLLRELVLSASNDKNTDAQIGRTLFQLLIPPEMEPFMGGTTSMVLEVDSGSAGIPWELLDSGAGTRNGSDERPWAIRSKLLRKLRTDDYRAQVIDADADARILVIGEPKCDPDRYERLPAAREEATAVVEAFTRSSPLRDGTGKVLFADRVRALIADEAGGADARAIMNAVLEREWRIVHIAGHGEPPEKIGPAPVNATDPPQTDGDPRGVVLSNGTFLGPREINTMRVVPELVFVNCCHLAARNLAQLGEEQVATQYDRARFAAGVAESLIKIGVRCVIAAGWAVGDEQAKEFARTFYDHLLNGSPFIDAVAEAREAACKLGGNTWAAYQCYGDPDWIFRWETGDAQAPTIARGVSAAGGESQRASEAQQAAARIAAEFAAVASAPALILALETLATRSRFDRPNVDEQRTKVAYLEARFGTLWRDVGRVDEAFGNAWQGAGDRRAAMAWYERAIAAGDGSATMRATEQLGNLRAREAEATVNRAQRTVQALEAKRTKANGAKLAAARKTLKAAVAQARSDVDQALGLLEPFANLRPSVERLSLCGSAWKRRAMIEKIGGDATAEDAAIDRMKQWYARAEKLARDQDDPALFYPAMNRMAAELIVDAKKKGWRGFDKRSLEAVRASLDAKTRSDPDFWSVLGHTELRLYEALASGSLAADGQAIQDEYDDLWNRVSAFGDWDSAYTQLEFVLPRYQARASPRERQAALDLIKHVRRIADRAKHPAATT